MSIGSSGLFAFPVSDRLLEFHRLLFCYREEFGATSGKTITWRPIGDPNLSDDVYRGVRSKQQERDDRAGVEVYRASVEDLGSEDAYCNAQYTFYANAFDVPISCAPLVVFSDPALSRRSVLAIDPNCLNDQARKRQLQAVLCKAISESRFNKFRTGGRYTDASMEKLQGYLDIVGLRIHKIVAPGAKRLPRKLQIRCGPQDPSKPVDTSVEAKLYWKMNTDTGELTVSIVWRGHRNSFTGFFGGRSTLQQNLLHLLLDNPLGIHVNEITRQLYPDCDEPKRVEARRGVRIDPRLRSLFYDTEKRLRKSGFPPGILPTLRPSSKLKLNVLEVKQERTDHIDRHLAYLDLQEAPDDLGL